MKRIVPLLAVLTGVTVLVLGQASRPASRPRSGSAPASMPAGRSAAVASASATGGGGEKTRVALEAKALQAQGLALSIHNDKALLAIGGPGIGKVLLERKGPVWPAELRVRLSVRGLESIVLTCGETTLSGAFSSHGDGGVSLHMVEDGKDGPALAKTSPYWMEIRPYDASGQAVKGLPPAGGYFELVVPKALLTTEADTLRLRWVDFWRG